MLWNKCHIRRAVIVIILFPYHLGHLVSKFSCLYIIKMVKIKTVLLYMCGSVRLLYKLGTKMSLSLWLYLFVAATALIGSYCIMHIMHDLWITTTAIIMFAPKLYIKFINYLMNFVDEPHCHMRNHCHHRQQQHHHHHHKRHKRHRHSHHRPPPPPPSSDSSSERWNGA